MKLYLKLKFDLVKLLGRKEDSYRTRYINQSTCQPGQVGVFLHVAKFISVLIEPQSGYLRCGLDLISGHFVIN